MNRIIRYFALATASSLIASNSVATEQNPKTAKYVASAQAIMSGSDTLLSAQTELNNLSLWLPKDVILQFQSLESNLSEATGLTLQISPSYGAVEVTYDNKKIVSVPKPNPEVDDRTDCLHATYYHNDINYTLSDCDLTDAFNDDEVIAIKLESGRTKGLINVFRAKDIYDQVFFSAIVDTHYVAVSDIEARFSLELKRRVPLYLQILEEARDNVYNEVKETITNSNPIPYSDLVFGWRGPPENVLNFVSKRTGETPLQLKIFPFYRDALCDKIRVEGVTQLFQSKSTRVVVNYEFTSDSIHLNQIIIEKLVVRRTNSGLEQQIQRGTLSRESTNPFDFSYLDKEQLKELGEIIGSQISLESLEKRVVDACIDAQSVDEEFLRLLDTTLGFSKI